MSQDQSYTAANVLSAMRRLRPSKAVAFVGDVGAWFAKEFCRTSAEGKLSIINRVRPTLRKAGFDICDSELGEPVGCEYCLNPDLYGQHKEIPNESDFALVSISTFTDLDGVVRYAELRARVTLGDTGAIGFDVPINYCPICGRHLKEDK